MNVRDSDGTVIFNFGPLSGGSRKTYEDCLAMKRPHLVVDAAEMTPEHAARVLDSFLRDHDIRMLNVAGGAPASSRGFMMTSGRY